MKEKVLFVDDAESILAFYKRVLQKQFEIETEPGAKKGLAAIESRGPFAVVVADQAMPTMTGIQFLARVKEISPWSVRMLLTGNADLEMALQAVNEVHVSRLLTKPIHPAALAQALQSGVQQFRVNHSKDEVIHQALKGSVHVLAEIHARVDPKSFQRTQSIRQLAKAFSEAASAGAPWELEVAAMLSQIGRVTVSTELIRKSHEGVELTAEEQQQLTRLPEVTHELLKTMPRLGSVAEMVLFQGKNFDGSGFPENGVSGEDIPYGARILKVLSDLCEIEAKGTSRAEAFDLLSQREGHYDPELLSTVKECLGKKPAEKNSPGKEPDPRGTAAD